MRIFLDQNIEKRHSGDLRALGHDVVHASELKLQSAPDEQILQLCRDQKRLMVTADIRMNKYLVETNPDSPSILVIRDYGFGSRQNPSLSTDLVAAINIAQTTIESGSHSVLVLRPSKPIRIRLLPLVLPEDSVER